MKRAFYLTLFFAFPFIINAQSLGIPAGGLHNFPDSAAINDTIKGVEVVIQNTDSLTYSNDTINIFWSVNGVKQSPLLQDFTPRNIPPNDTIILAIPDFVWSSPDFHIGGVNIIVVWPEAPGYMTSDSSVKTGVYVSPSSGFGEKASPSLLGVYPVPANDEIRIRYESLNTTIEQVRVYNLNGELECETHSDRISLAVLPEGLYMLEITLSNGSVLRQKLIKF